MMVYVTFGGMVATTWVQIIKACMLLAGGTLVAILAMSQFNFSFDKMMGQAISLHTLGDKLLFPGTLLPDPITALSLGLGLMFGTAGLPHILMRFFPNLISEHLISKKPRKSSNSIHMRNLAYILTRKILMSDYVL